MANLKEKFKIALDTWKETFITIRNNPALLIPFLVVGVFDGLLLLLIYMAPRPPLSALLAPPIRAFWGEKFLHYPLNLFLIPRLFNSVRIISTAFIGVLMTGVGIGMLKEVKQGLRPSFLFNLIKSLRMYLRLLAVWLVMFGLATLFFKLAPLAIKAKQGAALQAAFYLSFFITILIQVIFMYAMPAVMIEEKRFWPAIKRSVSFSRNAFLSTLILVAIPMLVFIPTIIFNEKLPMLMTKTFPEVLLIFMGLGIVLSMAVDCWITYSTTAFFLDRRPAR